MRPRARGVHPPDRTRGPTCSLLRGGSPTLPTTPHTEIAKTIKEAKLRKVQAAIQGDTVRISSASKDELQRVIALLKEKDFGVELKFGNFRSN